jgi:tRNA(adenine34) deaminase
VKDDEVISYTSNLKESQNDPTAHAEILAIREGTEKTGDWRLINSTLYVTKEPCVMCAGAMVNARLGRLVYGCKDKRFGAVDSVYNLTTDLQLNHRVDVTSGVLEEECSEILKTFFSKLRKNS